MPESARAEGVVRDGEAKVVVRLLADREVVYAGAPLRLGLLFSVAPGWHMYWRNPGQSGLPTEVDWDVPGGEPGPLQWPAPEVFAEEDGFLTTYGYADEVLLFAHARVDGELGERARIAAEVDYLACEIQCVPGRAEVSLDLPVEEADVPAAAEVVALFDAYAARVPVPAEERGLQVEALYSQTAIRPGDAFRGALALTGPPGTRVRPVAGPLAFVPEELESLELEVSGSRRHPLSEHGLIVHFTARADEDAPGDARLRGIVALDPARSPGSAVAIDVALPRAPRGAEVAAVANPWLDPPPPRPAVPFWRAVLLALAGGLILNLMPCVLPVLAIKVVGITELAHLSRRELLGHGLSYTAGILATMMALAASVVGLQLAGTQVGWGFQFQEPLFVAGISAVLVLFALNLFGVFEITLNTASLSQLEARAGGLRRSFFEGLLAVVVATPCSAPFLGTAVGFAFASPPVVIAGIFAAIGLGLASPYLLVTLVPAWARWIPRSGAWMLHLRSLLGFALLGTVVWLLWLQGRTSGVDGLIGLLAFLVVTGFAAWGFGALQRAASRRLLPAAVALLGIVTVAAVVALPSADAEGDAPAADGAIAWRAYDPAQIAATLREGRAVFVDFTADWCITCKLNERLVLSSERVTSELERLDVVAFKADWTRRDPAIREELARHGRAGVPMYLVYGPDAPDAPILLPELLSVDIVLDALRRASPDSATARNDRAGQLARKP